MHLSHLDKEKARLLGQWRTFSPLPPSMRRYDSYTGECLYDSGYEESRVDDANDKLEDKCDRSGLFGRDRESAGIDGYGRGRRPSVAQMFWRLVRRYVRRRAILLYWQEQTQRALFAPGGAGRKAERAAFELEFGDFESPTTEIFDLFW